MEYLIFFVRLKIIWSFLNSFFCLPLRGIFVRVVFKKRHHINFIFIIFIILNIETHHHTEKMRGGTRLTATTRTLQTRRRMQSVATATTRTAGSMRSSSHLLRKFLPSSLVLVLGARNSFSSSRKRTHFFSTNAAGRNNKEQGRGKGEGGGGQRLEEEEEEKRRG